MKKIMTVCFSFILFISFFIFPAEAQNKLPEELLDVSTVFEFNVKVKSAVLMDANTGTVLLAHKEREKLYPASVTKIMSLLLVCEALEKGKITENMSVTCSDSAANKGGSQIWLEPGEIMTVGELIKAAVISSANDACCLLGEFIAGSEEAFVSMMNKRAQELGMKDTHFDNSTGLDDHTKTHLTTAYDIALMSRELLKHDIIKKYSCTWMDTLRDGKTQLVNTNRLIRHYPGMTGLKTGTTSKAGCCISATASRDGFELIAVIMGAENSKDRFSAARQLLDRGFADYEIYKLKPDKYTEFVQVHHGSVQKLKLQCGEINECIINKGSAGMIKQKEILGKDINAPVQKGQKIGEIQFLAGETLIGSCDLKAAEEIEEMTLKNAFLALIYSLNNK